MGNSTQKKGDYPRKDDDIKFSNKILIFANDYFPLESSTALNIKGVTDSTDIVKFDMITTKLDRNLSNFDRIGKINVYRIGIGIPIIDKYILAFWGHRFAKKLNSQKKYSTIWGIGSDYGSFAAMFFKKEHPKIPFLLSLRDEDNPKHFRKKVALFDPSIKKIFTLANYIQCSDDELSEWARRMGSEAKISIIPSGINFDNFYKGDSRDFFIENLRNELSIEENEKIIIAGPTNNKKIAKNFIKAIGLLSNLDKILIKVLMFDSKKYESYLKKIAHKENVENKIIFLDKIKYEDMPNHLWISNVFVDISRVSIPLSFIFLAAMAADVPIISAQDNTLPNFFKANETGLLYDPNEPISIGDKIESLLDLGNDSALREKIINNGKIIASNQYNYEKIKILMEKIYDRLFEMKKKNVTKKEKEFE